MEPPIEPNAPTKRDWEPQKTLSISSYLCFDGKTDRLYLDPIELDQFGYRKTASCPRNAYSARSALTYEDIQTIHSIINDNFEILGENYDYDDYDDYDGGGWIITYTKPNLNYEKELNDFNSRFSTFPYKKKKYDDAMVLYNIWKKEVEIEELKKKLDKK